MTVPAYMCVCLLTEWFCRWCGVLRHAGVGYVTAFTLLMNYLSYLALKFYSGQQPRASVRHETQLFLV